MRDRWALAFVAMTIGAALSECGRAWPGESPGAGFALVLVAQVVVLSAMWTLPVAGGMAAVKWGMGRIGKPGTGEPGTGEPELEQATGDGRQATGDRRRGWVVWVPVVGFVQVTVGTAVLKWSAGAFVRQDLAAAVMSVALLIVFAGVAGAGWVAWRLTRERVERWPRWVIGLVGVGGVVAGGVIHLVRFPAVLDDPLLPALIQVGVVGAIGGAVMFGPSLPRPRRPGRMLIIVAGLGVVSLGLFVVLLFGGRIAPLSYPVASAAIDARGMTAKRVAPLLGRIGDRDGDGFGRWFGGLDCDDGDAAVNPLASDVPGNGVDDDCFEGDLAPAAVAADRQTRMTTRPAPRQRVRNAILITVDALRADAVGFAGGRKKSPTPNLDKLARRSAVFTSAWSQAPMTRKAFPSLLTGRYPSNVHWLDLGTSYPYPVSHEDNIYLAEVVRDAGVRTGMVVPFNYAGNSRFDQGFDERVVRPASRYKDEVCAPIIVDDAIRILEPYAPRPSPGPEPPPRFFLWVHFYEAHHPYVRHSKYDFGSSDHERYLSEVRSIDEEVGRLLATIESKGLSRDTAILFTGDHGEEFGEHGGEAHGDLYPEDLRVPLLVHVPGGEPRRIDAPVRLIDVAPTVLDLLGLPPPDSFDGDSLLAEVEGATARERLVVSELIPDKKVPRRVLSLVLGGWQLIVDFSLGSRQLFDLAHDPTAQRNLLIEAPGRARDLETELRRHLALRMRSPRTSRAAREKRR